MIEKQVCIQISEKGYGFYKLYFTVIDSTHVYMGSLSYEKEKCAIYHIGQLSHRPFYNDLEKWIHGEIQSFELMYKEYKE